MIYIDTDDENYNELNEEAAAEALENAIEAAGDALAHNECCEDKFPPEILRALRLVADIA